MVFSFGWLCVNKGSKQWQENWENHVNMLEDEVIGPLYKITLKRAPWKNVREHFENLVGPSPFSVSKVNLIISFYVTAMWVFLLLKVLVPTFSVSAKINWEYIILVGFSVSVCIGFWIFGRTDIGDYRSVAEERSAEIEPKESFGRINGKR